MDRSPWHRSPVEGRRPRAPHRASGEPNRPAQPRSGGTMTYPIPRPHVYSNPPPGLGRFLKGTWITSLDGRCAAKGEKVHVYAWENGTITYEALNAARNGYLTVEFSKEDIQSVGDVYKHLG